MTWAGGIAIAIIFALVWLLLRYAARTGALEANAATAKTEADRQRRALQTNVERQTAADIARELDKGTF